MTELCVCVLSFPGGRGTTTGWATALTTTFDGRGKFRGCKGRRSLPSPRAHCTVCAAQRTVRLLHLILPFVLVPHRCVCQLFQINTLCYVAIWYHRVPTVKFKSEIDRDFTESFVVFGSGEVYTWGDNDEGQLGDGTTNAIQRPRLVAALQGKKINRVACGSAHTLAWSTSKPTNAGKLPAQVLQLITVYMFENELSVQ